MRGVFLGIVSVLLALQAGATDYVYVSVGGDTTAQSMTSGDTLSFGCNLNGRGVWWEVYVDLDHSGAISPADKFLVGLPQVDQDYWVRYGIPDPDSSIGWVRVDLGASGIAPGYTYIVRATDEDASSAYDTLLVLPLGAPGGFISGTVALEGVSAPDSSLAMIEVEASLGGIGGFWMTLTDTNGDYRIEVDSSSLGTQYNIGTSEEIYGFVGPPYDTATIQDSVTNMDFLYRTPSAMVVGTVTDDLGDSLRAGVALEVVSEVFGRRDRSLYQPGKYFVSFPDSELGLWNIGLGAFGLLPFYLVPPSRELSIGAGDTLVEDFTVYRADTTIAGRVTIMDTVPLDTFHFIIAECETSGVGLALIFSDSLTGTYEAGVNSADSLTWRLAIDPPMGDRVPGHVVEDGFVRMGLSAGDSVHFNFVPATDTIGGQISFHASVPGSLQFPLDSLGVLYVYWTVPLFPFKSAAGMVRPDPLGWHQLFAEPDTYAVFCSNFPDTNYYTNPAFYDSLVIDGDTDTLDFVIYHRSIGVGDEKAGSRGPGEASLSQCSPNPFSVKTTVRAVIPEALDSGARVCVYDVAGRLVRVLARGERGPLVLSWDGRDATGNPLPGGIYYLRLELPKFAATRKAVLLR